jgi:hypothetical protein
VNRKFNQPVGGLRFVRMQHEAPPFIAEERRRGKRAQGLLYEARVHEEFGRRYPGYIPSMWFSYGDAESDEKWCQTDGLIIDPWKGRIVIVEVKLSHCAAAFYQLFKTYLPVMRELFGGTYTFACVEVVRWFDCATLVPKIPTLCKEVEHARENQFNVHIWRPGDGNKD